MKRINNKIDYQETGRFELVELSERYHYPFFNPTEKSWVKVSFITGCQQCNVYTNKDTVLTALQKLNGPSTYPIVFDLDKKRMDSEQNKIVVNNINYNNQFNCHGFTFLDGLFWFLLDNEMVDTIIADDDYQACTLETLKENGICLYYNSNNELIHSARVLDGIIQSKFGINTIITKGETELIEKYKESDLDVTKTRYFNVNGFYPRFKAK